MPAYGLLGGGSTSPTLPLMLTRPQARPVRRCCPSRNAHRGRKLMAFVEAVALLLPPPLHTNAIRIRNMELFTNIPREVYLFFRL